MKQRMPQPMTLEGAPVAASVDHSQALASWRFRREVARARSV